MKNRFSLTELFDDSFVYKGFTYTVNMYFNNILLLFEMFDDKLINEHEKPIIAIEMLVNEEIGDFDSWEDAINLFKYLLREFLNIDLDDKSTDDGVKVFDYKKDAEIIFASFYAEYGIDLFEVHDKLHWKKFYALLVNLNDNSKFKQVLGYRVMDIPKKEHVSEEYRKQIIKLKKAYALEGDDDNSETQNDEQVNKNQINDTFNAVAEFFKK